MKSLRLLPGLAAALALLAVLALAPPVAADAPSAADSVTGVASVNALLDEAAAATGGVDGARVSVSGGATVDPSAFPATRLASNETFRTGWDLAADASQVGNPGVDNGIVYALATAADGTVYVGGSFTSAGGNASIQYIGKWRRNTGWAALGTFTAGTVRAITIGSDGKVYVGGDFSDVKMWNGSAWSTVGSATFSGGSVRALAVGSSGAIYRGRRLHRTRGRACPLQRRCVVGRRRRHLQQQCGRLRAARCGQRPLRGRLVPECRGVRRPACGQPGPLGRHELVHGRLLAALERAAVRGRTRDQRRQPVRREPGCGGRRLPLLSSDRPGRQRDDLEPVGL